MALCVGGPLDGHEVDVGDSIEFVFQTHCTVRYVRRLMAGFCSSYTVYTPDDYPPAEIMPRLLKRYSKLPRVQYVDGDSLLWLQNVLEVLGSFPSWSEDQLDILDEGFRAGMAAYNVAQRLKETHVDPYLETRT